MRFLLLAATSYAVFSLQLTLASRLQLGPARVDLVVIALLWLIKRMTPAERYWLAAAWGLVADALGDGPMGVHVVWYTLLACGVEACGQARGGSGWLAPGLCALLGIATGRLVIDSLGVGLAGAQVSWPTRLWVALASAISTTLVAVPGWVMAGGGVSSRRAAGRRPNPQTALRGGLPASIS